ncbi:oxidoreductase [Kitasatospora sp. NBC_00240]|uniref:oxidoreductase n=1 Tax=Kitasatospora sp. NBC_00240 TaxID=2903567 RepID=UPI002257861B|nr:oxidoreductase [Kitasatospora sp. NBC_00240]MCX5213502.1 oxidoreductase [Kitasatospora sp. NBC_00240]
MEQAPEDWTPVEQGLWEAFRQGVVYNLATRTGERLGAPGSNQELDGPAERDDVFGDAPWGPERTVRAEVIARLLLDGPAPIPGRVAALKLTGAQVTGPLVLAGGTITHYVEMHDCRFANKLLMSEARAGTLRFVTCLIPRIEASRLATEGDLHLARCRIPDGIRLTDARIGTDLLLNQAVVGADRFGRSLSADGMSIHQDFEADRLESTGELSLRTARIGGRLSLRGAQLRSTPQSSTCLNAVRLSVGHTLYLTSSADGGWNGSRTYYGSGYGESPPPGSPSTPFRAYGKVRLSDSRFESACLISGEFHLGPGQELSLSRIHTPELRFACRMPPTGKVSLSRARVGNLVDAPASWPAGKHLGLTGFTYEVLRPLAPFSVQQRIAWLESASVDFQPESYEQLAAALRRDGADDDAREVLYAKQRRRHATLPLPSRVWGRVQEATVGYGYRPGRAALWLLLAWLLGTLFFQQHPPEPLKADERPHWNAALYTLGQLLPVVDLGQSGWNPAGAGQWVTAGLVTVGWVLATTVVAGATRLLQRG